MNRAARNWIRLGVGTLVLAGLAYGGFRWWAPRASISAPSCGAVIGKINAEVNCEEKWTLFQRHRPDCNNQPFQSNENELYTYDEQAWEIEKCFDREKKEDRARAVLKALADGPSWTTNGPVECDQPATARALLEAKDYPEAGCLKREDFGSWTGKPFSLSVESLRPFARRNQPLDFGSLQASDDSCPAPLAEVLAHPHAKLPLQALALESTANDSSSFFIPLQDADGRRIFALFFKVHEECFVLAGLHEYEITTLVPGPTATAK